MKEEAEDDLAVLDRWVQAVDHFDRVIVPVQGVGLDVDTYSIVIG